MSNQQQAKQPARDNLETDGTFIDVSTTPFTHFDDSFLPLAQYGDMCKLN